MAGSSLPDRPGSWQVCAGCDRELPSSAADARCPDCGGLLEVRHRPPVQDGAKLRELFLSRRGRTGRLDASGVWKYRELVLPEAGADDVVTHPEGNTPLLSRASVSRFAGVESLHLKHEGHNPTGSFKDRGMTVGMTQARRVGARAVACASTGNTSASLAAYAANAGLPALVFVPSGQVALGKLAQTLAYGAKTLLVRGDFDECFALVRQASEKLNVYLLNSVNPFRIEGQKTIVFEALEQLLFDPPDWIALPAGNLGNTSAFGKALKEARELGLIPRLPRLACIQAAGANPFARAFREGFVRPHRVKAETVATAIKIGDPASLDRGIAAVRLTHGVVTDVTDEEILEAKAVVDASGVGCEPASAASVAGVRKLAAQGVIRQGDRVVAVLTGHILKDPGLLLDYHREREPAPARANRPIEIEPTLSAVEAVLSRQSP
ncbi:MAG TPA: threonine synthase [Thermoanaerobaculia bacterium]|nr:threonine synthase [Thermoanaerobaculia bacterium]